LFSYIPAIGKTTPPNGNYNRSFSLVQIGNTYQLKIGIVPKDKGLFLLILGSPAGIYRNNQVCTKASFTFNFENTNQHLYLDPYYDSTAIIPPNPDYVFEVY